MDLTWLIRRLSLRGPSSQLTQVVGGWNPFWIQVNSLCMLLAVLDGSRRSREHPLSDHSSLWLCHLIFSDGRGDETVQGGWGAFCRKPKSSVDIDHPAMVPKVLQFWFESWSPYFVSEHLVGRDFASLTPSTVFDILKVLHRWVWNKLNEWDVIDT